MFSRALLFHAVRLPLRDFRAIKRLGVDAQDGDRPDDIPIAVDELPNGSRLIEMPGDTEFGDVLLARKVLQLGRGGGIVFGINDGRRQRGRVFRYRFAVIRIGLGLGPGEGERSHGRQKNDRRKERTSLIARAWRFH